MTADAATPTYERIYTVVRQIPAGKVASYGQVAAIVGGVTPRMVGYAMAAVPEGSDVPWQRVINSQGKVSPRADHLGSEVQRMRLADEGVYFVRNGAVDWSQVRWPGPEIDWLIAHGYAPLMSWTDELR